MREIKNMKIDKHDLIFIIFASLIMCGMIYCTYMQYSSPVNLLDICSGCESGRLVSNDD